MTPMLKTLLMFRRGHAAQDRLQVDKADSEKLPANWTKLTSALRQNPAWQEPSTARNGNTQYLEIEAKLVEALLDEN